MGTIDQPKPSEPKSPQSEQQPLQPGQSEISGPRSATPQRPHLTDEEPLQVPERERKGD